MCDEKIEINSFQIETQNENAYDKILNVIRKYNESHSPVFKPNVFGPEESTFTNGQQSQRHKMQKKRKKRKGIRNKKGNRNWTGGENKHRNDFQENKCNFRDCWRNPDHIYRNYRENEVWKQKYLNPNHHGNHYKQKHRKMGTWPDFSKRVFL